MNLRRSFFATLVVLASGLLTLAPPIIAAEAARPNIVVAYSTPSRIHVRHG